MEKEELEKLKSQLKAERARIADGINHIERDNLNRSQRDAAGDLSGYSFHMADMATDNFDREFSLDLASNEQAVLNRIDEALNKIEEGTYGICENCEKPISFKRLKAVPYAKLCIKCKEEEEKKARPQ
ncbi:MAG: TraR/DksA C4-type zinc finger protein [Candidatus Omnitrophica bacterium]|nr:TraR/DksA C4-type zinc finger protein [Candidatus Omnitrophota bacterium]